MGEYKRNNENKKDSNQCGIYSITNLLNGKRYIGQTYDFKYRWMRHRSYLKNNTEHNSHLQNAWNKYGSQNFKFEIIEICPFEKLDEREIYWIEYYDSTNTGYNFSEGGLGCKGYKHTPEEIMKMRMIQNPKSIVMLDLQGNYEKTFVSSGEAASYLGKSSSSGIKRCCEKDKYKKAYGHIWVYEEDYKNNNVDWDYYFKENSNKPKPVLQYDSEMNLIKEYSSAREVLKFGFDNISVSEVCNGRKNSYLGYIWVWKNNPELHFDEKEKREKNNLLKKFGKLKKIAQYTKDGEFIKLWNSLEIKENNLNLNAIQNNCCGYTHSSQGYIWKYFDEEQALA